MAPPESPIGRGIALTGLAGASSSTPRILFPYNGSPTAQVALDVAAEWGLALRAEVWVLYVRACDVSRGGHYYAETRAEARAVAVEAAVRLRVRGVSASGLIRDADRGRIARAIRVEADVLDARVIVVGTRARSAFGSVLRGSVSRSVARRAARPVVLVTAVATPTLTAGLQPHAPQRRRRADPGDR